MIYKNLIYPAEFPKAHLYWQEKFGIEIDWILMSNAFNNKVTERKIVEFRWKCLFGAVNTETRLKKWGKSNGVCKLCTEEQETLDHLLFKCSRTKSVWDKMQGLIQGLIMHTWEINCVHISLGVMDNEINEKEKEIVNMIIFSTKWMLWKNRNENRYEGKQCTIEQLFCRVKQSLKKQILLIPARSKTEEVTAMMANISNFEV